MSTSQLEFQIQEDLTAEDMERLRASEAVSIDCEMTGLNPHRDLLCLVQVCDHDGRVNFLRTDDWTNAKNLKSVFSDPAIMKVFHFALMDCSFIMKKTGADPVNVYCTKIASKLARTYSPEHGLSRLTQELLNVKLDKSQQTTDWLADELTPAQLKYAANDVIWLNEIRATLDDLLKRKGELPSGESYHALNEKCRAFIPTLCHLFLGGWSLGDSDRTAVFTH
jgi:ribonuclease D